MTRILFYLNAVFWLFLSIYTITDMIMDGNELSVFLVGFFLLVNVAALFFSGKLLDQNEKLTYIFALIVIVLNIGLAFTGVPELLYVTALVIDVLILLVLISLKNIYFK
ncbi:MAG: hypothetical protein IPL27_20340 [Lewinellaceae bacterium]|nr:hypothetical protein [Lewinellaceae bacterium]